MEVIAAARAAVKLGSDAMAAVAALTVSAREFCCAAGWWWFGNWAAAASMS